MLNLLLDPLAEPFDFRGLVAQLARFDAAHLLAAVSGLQLMPENASHAVRLEALAHVAAAVRSSATRQIAKGKLLELANQPPIGSGRLVAAEDPADNPFTEAVTFHGGSYLVLPGPWEDETFVFQNLAGAIFHHPQGIDDPDVLATVTELAMAVLALSDAVLRRCGYKRGVAAGAGKGGDVAISSSARLTTLAAAATFTDAELDQIMTARGVREWRAVLPLLAVRQGDVDVSAYRAHDGPPIARPLVWCGNRLVVAVPCNLQVALRHAILRICDQAGLGERLADNYRDTVWRSVTRSLGWFGLDRCVAPIPEPPPTPGWREGLFSLDRDKVLYAIAVTDPLGRLADRKAYHSWEPPLDFDAALARRVAEVERALYGCSKPPSEVLFLLVCQGIGGRYLLRLPVESPGSASPSLLLSAADLRTMALLEHADPLALWKYARALQRLSARTDVVSPGVLTTFEFYRSRRHGFYIGDGAAPDTLIGLSPGGAGRLRQIVAQRHDPHAALAPEPTSFKDVIALRDASEAAVYIATRPRPGWIELLAYAGETPVWLVEEVLAHGHPGLGEAIAFWIADIGPSLAPALERLAVDRVRLVIRLRQLPGDLAEGGTAGPDGEDGVEAVGNAETGEIELTIAPTLTGQLNHPSNRGERLLLRRLLRAIHTLLPDAEQSALSEEAVEAIVDRHAPEGVKRHVVAIADEPYSSIDSRDLSEQRLVQEADVEELLDELGAHLRLDLGLPQGPVPDEKRGDVLNAAVTFFFSRLEHLVASLDRASALEWLIRRHETLIHHAATRALTVTTRLACFGDGPDAVRRMGQESSDLAKASLAARFVLEYAAARPPAGLRPVSLSAYDRLQALASLIGDYGMESEYIQHGLADFKVAILPSGRLGVNRTTFNAAKAAFAELFASQETARAREGFADWWPDDPGSPSPWLDCLQAATKAEFGEQILDIVDFLDLANHIFPDLDHAVGRVPEAGFIEEISRALGWESTRSRRLLDQLTLEPRMSFLRPPSPYRSRDVYPWLFNRPLSHLRRPFIRRTSGEGVAEVLWGRRHLGRTGQFLTSICANGRLVARTHRMRQFITDYQAAQGRAFNEEVAGVFRADPSAVVRTQVNKIGKVRIAGPSGDLGDVDVLAALPRTREVMLVECKKLARSRTPYEVAGELNKLMVDVEGTPAFITKHRRRVEWVRDHLPDVLSWLGVDAALPWQLRPLVVLEHESLAAFLRQSDVPICTLGELKVRFDSRARPS